MFGIVTALGLLGVIISAYVWYKQVTSGEVFCLGSGCAVVIRSRYGRLLGIPNGALGLCYFAGTAAAPIVRAWMPSIWQALLAVTVIALALYSYLTYLQFFVLRRLCSWCLTSAALTVAIFWSLLKGG